jgi:hypothetical protein
MTPTTTLPSLAALMEQRSAAQTAYENAAADARHDAEARAQLPTLRQRVADINASIQDLEAAAAGQKRKSASRHIESDLHARVQAYRTAGDIWTKRQRVAREIQSFMLGVGAAIAEDAKLEADLHRAVLPLLHEERARQTMGGSTWRLDDHDLRDILAGAGLGRVLDVQHPSGATQDLVGRIVARTERYLARLLEALELKGSEALLNQRGNGAAQRSRDSK